MDTCTAGSSAEIKARVAAYVTPVDDDELALGGQHAVEQVGHVNLALGVLPVPRACEEHRRSPQSTTADRMVRARTYRKRPHADPAVTAVAPVVVDGLCRRRVDVAAALRDIDEVVIVRSQVSCEQRNEPWSVLADICNRRHSGLMRSWPQLRQEVQPVRYHKLGSST